MTITIDIIPDRTIRYNIYAITGVEVTITGVEATITGVEVTTL